MTDKIMSIIILSLFISLIAAIIINAIYFYLKYKRLNDKLFKEEDEYYQKLSMEQKSNFIKRKTEQLRRQNMSTFEYETLQLLKEIAKK